MIFGDVASGLSPRAYAPAKPAAPLTLAAPIALTNAPTQVAKLAAICYYINPNG